MKTLRQIIAGKGNKLASIAPDETVLRALQIMAELDIGALAVMDGKQLVGMFSERDYARKVILHGKASKDTAVREVMTDKVIYVTPQESVEDCMALMTEKRVRHLPVLGADNEVLGVISIGDVVKEMICEQKFVIEQLERYITG